ncbi:uncharacterized protein A1O9_08601, partial [Exophiala aquamarina CBS 119918]
SKWEDDIDTKEKRVGIIGNGSTGIQIINIIAPEVDSLTCFIRHPQYVAPAGLRDFTPEELEMFKSIYKQMWRSVRDSASAFGFVEPTRTFAEASPRKED